MVSYQLVRFYSTVFLTGYFTKGLQHLCSVRISPLPVVVKIVWCISGQTSAGKCFVDGFFMSGSDTCSVLDVPGFPSG